MKSKFYWKSYVFLFNIWNPFRLFFQKVEKFFYWGWTMRNSEDWDFFYLEETIAFKLRRMEKSIFVNGHHVYNKNCRSRRAIKEVIHIFTNTPEKTQFFKPHIVDDFLDKTKKRELGHIYKLEELEAQRVERAYFLIKKWRNHWWS